MIFKTLLKLKHGVIIDVDNYTNEHLSDPIFIQYLIKFSEKGGASAFLSKNIENIKILKQNTSFPIFAEIEENFNDILIPKTYEKFRSIIELKPNFICIELCNFEKTSKDLENLIKEIKINFDGGLVGKVSNRNHALEAYRLGMDAISVEIFGECLENELIKEVSSYINIPIIASLNSVSFEQGRNLIDMGVHSFVLGEDVTNPNKIINQLTT